MNLTFKRLLMTTAVAPAVAPRGSLCTGSFSPIDSSTLSVQWQQRSVTPYKAFSSDPFEKKQRACPQRFFRHKCLRNHTRSRCCRFCCWQMLTIEFCFFKMSWILLLCAMKSMRYVLYVLCLVLCTNLHIITDTVYLDTQIQLNRKRRVLSFKLSCYISVKN